MTPDPDIAAICRHLALVAGPQTEAAADCKIEIAWGRPDVGPSQARLFPATALQEAAHFAVTANGSGCNVYVGTTIKRAAAATDRRTSTADAALATCIAIDIDNDLVVGARKLPLKPHLLVVTGNTPTLRGHLWLRINSTQDFDLWEDLTTRAVVHCGGDMAARGRSRVMRLGGTVSYPSNSKQQRGYEIEPVKVHSFDAPIYDLADLLQAFPPLPRPPIGLTASRSRAQVYRTPSALDVARVACALAALPTSYADEHDLWVRTGFALHSFDAGASGLELWKAFSARCPSKACQTNFEQRWTSFGRASGRTISIRWLFNEARRHGWRPSVAGGHGQHGR